MTDTPPDVDRLAAIIDPDAFDDTVKKSERTVAVVQWAARRHMARVSAQRIIDSDLWAERQADALSDAAQAAERDGLAQGLVAWLYLRSDALRERRCLHRESMYGRCTSCGMTWEEQARDREAVTRDE